MSLRPAISVVMSTYNRAHLLGRSLACYKYQPFQDFEIIVIDDDSSDDTESVCQSFSTDLDIKYIKVWKKEKKWRDCAATINLGIRASKGAFVVPTHPEVMPGIGSLSGIFQNLRNWEYICCKVYYMTPVLQRQIDDVNWRDGAGNVRELPGFYDNENPDVLGPASDYSTRATDEHKVWESWVFGGLSMATWRKIGGMTEFETWGSIDMDFLSRRKVLGIPTYTLTHPETIVVHQNHDDLGTPRDMDAAMAALKPYPNYLSAIRSNL